MKRHQTKGWLQANGPKGHMLAHITPKEGKLLKFFGGSGAMNKKTGIKSYAQENDVDFDDQRSTWEKTKDWASDTFTGPTLEGQRLEHERVANMGQDGFDVNGNAIVEGIVETGATATGQITDAVGNLTGGGMQTRNNTSSSISELDRPTHEFRQNVYDGATEVMDKEYQSYADATGTMTDASGLTEGQDGYNPATAQSVGGNDRFADASTDTLNAQQGVRDLQGRGQGATGAYAQAGAVGKDVSGYSAEQVGGGNFLAGQGVDKYMNPHTSAVIGGLQDNAMKSMQMGRNQIGASSQMAGAGMGSRAALEKGAMAGEVMSNLNQQTGQLLNQSYKDASAQKRADMQMNQSAQQYNQRAGLDAQGVRLQGANAQVSAMDAGRGAGYQDAGMLSNVGADIEGRDQNDKDFAYDEYMEGRDWDKNNVSFGSNVLSGAPTGTTTTQNNPQYRNQKVDRFGRIISGAATGWLATGSPYGAAAGGVMGAMG